MRNAYSSHFFYQSFDWLDFVSSHVLNEVERLAERVIVLINGRLAALDDSRAFFRGELKTLDADLRTAVAKTTGRETRLHIDDVRTQIQRALDPTVQESAAAAAARTALTDEIFDVSIDPESCWLDNAIRGARQR